MGEDLSSDVIVIGAGAIGASCACHLARAGLRVTVAEAFGGPAEGAPGGRSRRSGPSGRTR